MEPAKILSPENLSFGMLAGHAWRSLAGKRLLAIGAMLLTGVLGWVAKFVAGFVSGIIAGLLVRGEGAPEALAIVSALLDLLSGLLLGPLNIGSTQ